MRTYAPSRPTRPSLIVTWGIGGEATAFAAIAGSGKPVVALLAEYDALPGLSQAAEKAKKQALVENGPGHGCDHNLLGTAAVAAAIAANRTRIEQKLPARSSSSEPRPKNSSTERHS